MTDADGADWPPDIREQADEALRLQRLVADGPIPPLPVRNPDRFSTRVLGPEAERLIQERMGTQDEGTWTIVLRGGQATVPNLALFLRSGCPPHLGNGITDRLIRAMGDAKYVPDVVPQDRHNRESLLVARRLRGPEATAFDYPAYRNDCGLDLALAEDTEIPDGGTVNAPTGVAVALPPGTFGWIVARSSTWTRHGLLVLPGIIDEGWRGELRVLLHRPVINQFRPPLELKAGTRLGQLLVLPNLVPGLRYAEADELPPGERGEQGFGSSGL